MNIKLEIGENLYLQIENIKFTPGKAGYISGRPEDCYEDEPPEIDWNDEDCKIIRLHSEFECPKYFSGTYYEEILEKCIEEYENEKRNIY